MTTAPARGKAVVFEPAFWLKGCPKCHGDLVMDSDEYGQFVRCMQCGYSRDVGVEVAALEATTPPPEQLTRQEYASKGGRETWRRVERVGPTIAANVAAEMQAWRKANGLTQDAFARRLGVTKETLNNYLMGRVPMPLIAWQRFQAMRDGKPYSSTPINELYGLGRRKGGGRPGGQRSAG